MTQRLFVLLSLGFVACNNSGLDPERVQHYIRSDIYQKLLIEMDAVTGLVPADDVQNYIEMRFDTLLDKPEGVDVVSDETLAARGTDYAWTFSELNTLARNGLQPDSGTTIRIQTLFVDGHYENDTDNSKTLGIAWANRYITIFAQTIRELCEGAGLTPGQEEDLCESALTSVWVHELGHVLGLVNNGLDMVEPHQDTERGAHDSSDECVMYWAYEGSPLIDDLLDQILLGSAEPLDFGPNCIADIEAARM